MTSSDAIPRTLHSFLTYIAVRKDDIETMSIICRFTCCFGLKNGPKSDTLGTFEVESTWFRRRRIVLSLAGIQRRSVLPLATCVFFPTFNRC